MGAFILRNLNIAPFFREYQEEKTKIVSILNRKQQSLVQQRKQESELNKQRYNEFYTKRWEIFRKTENDRIDQEVAQARR